MVVFWRFLPIRQNFINLNKIQADVRLKRANMSVFNRGMLYIFGIYVLILSAIFVALEHMQKIPMNRILKANSTFLFTMTIKNKGAHHEFSCTC